MLPFVLDLFGLVDGAADGAAWTDDGKAFRVHDGGAFRAALRARGLTRSGSWPSIVRQLNEYGFRKSRGALVFAHADFVRGRRDRLVHVQTRARERYRRPAARADSEEDADAQQRAFLTAHAERVEALVAELRRLEATLASGGASLLDPDDLFG